LAETDAMSSSASASTSSSFVRFRQSRRKEERSTRTYEEKTKACETKQTKEMKTNDEQNKQKNEERTSSAAATARVENFGAATARTPVSPSVAAAAVARAEPHSSRTVSAARRNASKASGHMWRSEKARASSASWG